MAKGKTYIISHKGNTIQLETDYKRSDSLGAIIKTVFNEMRKLKPDALDDIMLTFNRWYFMTLQQAADKAAKKAEQDSIEYPTEPEAIRNHWIEVERLYKPTQGGDSN